jgi:hypothetical protein
MLMAMASGNKQILLAKQQDKASNHSMTVSYGHTERMGVRNKQGRDFEMPIGRKPRQSVGRENKNCLADTQKQDNRRQMLEQEANDQNIDNLNVT